MPSSNPLRPVVIKHRRDFLAVAKRGVKSVTPSLVVQKLDTESSSDESSGDEGQCRYGITASKKVGKAVQRNRAKRRLRALIRQYWPQSAEKNADYVLIARHNTPHINWDALKTDFQKALKRVNAQSKRLS